MALSTRHACHSTLPRLPYVMPDGPLVDQGDPWSTAPAVSAGELGDEHRSTGGDPYFRLFVGSQSEGTVAVKGHEATPPRPGLLVGV